MTTHADLLAAIEALRHPDSPWGDLSDEARDLFNDYLDTLRAILDLHQPTGSGEDYGYCDGCFNGCDWDTCPTAQVVVDALTRMGALP